jgi:hypothetical protein
VNAILWSETTLKSLKERVETRVCQERGGLDGPISVELPAKLLANEGQGSRVAAAGQANQRFAPNLWVVVSGARKKGLAKLGRVEIRLLRETEGCPVADVSVGVVDETNERANGVQIIMAAETENNSVSNVRVRVLGDFDQRLDSALVIAMTESDRGG